MEENREEIVTTTTTEALSRVPVRQTIVLTPARATTERVEHTTVATNVTPGLYTARTQQVIWTIWSFVEGLIAIRFGLRLFGANSEAGFAQLIYGLTAPLVAPFNGLFGTPRFEGSAFEFTSLVAMLVYALLAWVIVKLLLMVVGNRAGTVRERTDTWTE